MFNLAIDSKLRGCDVVAIKVDDVAAGGYADAEIHNLHLLEKCSKRLKKYFSVIIYKPAGRDMETAVAVPRSGFATSIWC